MSAEHKQGNSVVAPLREWGRADEDEDSIASQPSVIAVWSMEMGDENHELITKPKQR